MVCTVAVQRIEVITGAGGRRTYSAEEKIRLVGEARGGRGAVAAVARRHPINRIADLMPWNVDAAASA
ncbi:transposase [Azospirillum sp. HJ39]|uniref:hypothetical protein n=1 Tax=Azospirillum sp. HJ39 TaxID=3159496 RepID=UPI0035578BA3